MNQRDRPTPGKPPASVRAARRDAAGGAELTQRPSPSHCPRSALVRYAHRCLVYGGADLLMRASPALRQPHRHQSVWRWGTHPHPVSPCPAAASCPPRRPPSATCRCTLAFVPYPACAVRVIPVLPAARHSCANHRRARRSHFCRAQRSPRRRPRRQRVALGLAHRCPPRARRARPPRCHHLCHPEGMPLGWLSRGTRTGAPLPRRQMQARVAFAASRSVLVVGHFGSLFSLWSPRRPLAGDLLPIGLDHRNRSERILKETMQTRLLCGKWKLPTDLHTMKGVRSRIVQVTFVVL